MRAIIIGVLGLMLVHGNATAQTTAEQAQIVRTFQDALTAITPYPPIFTLPVATVFRQIIATALGAQAPVSVMSGVGDGLPLDRHPLIFEPFPATELSAFPAILKSALPALPEWLEYRLIGNDLVLRDRSSGVIVAVLRDALGRVATVKR